MNISLLLASCLCLALTEAGKADKMDKKTLQEHGLWDVSMHWNNDVYSGTHFDEIVTSPWATDGVVMRSTVLLMYDESTWQDVVAYDLTTTGLPYGQHLRFLRYNYETTPKHIWYNLSKRDDLVSRYLYDNPTTINPEIFFFKKGSHVDQPVRFPIETVDFDEDPLAFRRWIWQQCFTRFELNNYLGRRVKISFDGDGPDTQVYDMKDKETQTIDAWVGKRMLITDKDGKKLLIGMVVAESADNAKFDLVKENMKNFENATVGDFLVDTHMRMQLDYEEDKRYSEWISMFYLKSFKQPVMLPKYSSRGYERGPMPDALYDSLMSFYNARRRKYADCVLSDGSKNGDEVKCRQIPLTNEHRIQIAHIVLPIAQKWAGVDLEMTYTYGVNEYLKDSIIKNGLCRVDDHIISAELVLFKDNGGMHFED